MILLFKAFVLGLIGGLIPGPVLTAIFTEIIQKGFYRSFRLILVALLAESSVALFSMIFFSAMGFPEIVFKIISLVGAGILIWISISLWKIKTLDPDEQLTFGFIKILLLILANGMLWTFWITICIPQALELKEILLFGEYYFLTLVEVGWLITTTLAAFVFSRFRWFLSKPQVIPYLFKIFFGVFIYFALSLIYDSLSFFIS